jgi:hypothetical protein
MLKVKPRVREEVETLDVRCRAGRFAGSGCTVGAQDARKP